MNQMNMFLELIKYFLTIEEVDNKDVLRKKYCGFNDTYKKYFGIVWKTLEQLDILIDNKLNPNYINAYNLKDNDIDFVIDSTINIIKQYSVKNNDCDKDLKFFRSDITNEDESKYLQESEKDLIYYPMQMKNSIINIFNRVINPKNEYTPNKIYETIKNPLIYNKHKNTHYVFKLVLVLLLEKDDELKSDEILTITDKEILDIADNYVDHKYTSYEKTKINMKNDVINALKLSKIIEENETNPYKVNPFIDKEWRLDATTKTTAIEKVINKIVKLKSLTPKQIKLINEIFQYSE
ncbi:hypothetical protein [Aliarcobacter butzleri]|uniref:hypothetical protein n=1 Tax=Aliarcobacter butzleri TaxID=28197 RepID=UPI003AF7BE95